MTKKYLKEKKPRQTAAQFDTHQYKSVLETLPYGVVFWDLQRHIRDINEIALKAMSAKKEDVLGKRCKELFTCEKGEHQCLSRNAMEKDEVLNDEERTILTNSGKTINAPVTVTPIKDPDGNVIGSMEIIRQVTDFDDSDEKYVHLPVTDQLTGLANRRGLLKQLHVELKRCERFHTPFSLLMIDIDDFKSFNDAHGAAAGDNLIRTMADCLRKTLRLIDYPARYGGEEFAVLLPGIKVEKARLCAERIRHCVEIETKKIHPDKKSVTVSIGASSYEKNGHKPNAQLLISLADTALYRAKQTGKNRVILAKT